MKNEHERIELQEARPLDANAAARETNEERAWTREVVARCRTLRRLAAERRRSIADRQKTRTRRLSDACAALSAASPKDQERLANALGDLLTDPDGCGSSVARNAKEVGP